MKLRFTTRGLFLLVAVIAVLCATIGRDIAHHQARHGRERVAIVALQKLGARIGLRSDAPFWAVGRLGDWEIFRTVYSVDLWRSTVSDNDVAVLPELHNLSMLEIGTIPGVSPKVDAAGAFLWPQMSVTDRSLEYLLGLPLEVLHLDRTHITDAGIDKLCEFTSLTFLSVRATDITANGVEELRRRLPDCKVEWSPVYWPPDKR